MRTLNSGNLNAGKTDLSGTPVWQEDWNYDPTGNWRGATSAYVTKVGGDSMRLVPNTLRAIMHAWHVDTGKQVSVERFYRR